MGADIKGSVFSTDIDKLRRDIDFATAIAELDPDATPFTVVMKKSKTRKTQTAEYVWWEDQLGPRWDAINEALGYEDDDTELVVDNVAYFAAHDVVKVPRTGEVMRVTAVDADTSTLTVVRGWGTSEAAALEDDEPLQIIGNANAEGAGAPAQKVGQPTKVTNYAQIFRTPFGVTGTTDAEKQVTGPERARLRKKKGIEHMIDLERAFLFGEKKEDTSGGEVRRATSGLLSFITTNVFDAKGELTEDDFDTGFSEMAFAHGSSRKLLLASPRLSSLLTTWAKGKLQTVPTDKSYGLTLKEYVTAHGVLYLAEHRLLTGAVYGLMGVVIDPENIAYRPLRDTKLRQNIQDNDVDGFVDEYLTEAGLEVKLPDSHAMVIAIDA